MWMFLGVVAMILFVGEFVHNAFGFSIASLIASGVLLFSGYIGLIVMLVLIVSDELGIFNGLEDIKGLFDKVGPK